MGVVDGCSSLPSPLPRLSGRSAGLGMVTGGCVGGGGIATDCTLHPKGDTSSFETRMLKGKSIFDCVRHITCCFVPYISLLLNFEHFVKKTSEA